MIPKKAIRLADLEPPVGEIVVRNAKGEEREVAVKPIDGRMEQYRQAFVNGIAQPRDTWRLAGLILPDATAEEIELLTPHAIGLVVQMASGHLEEVLLLAQAAGKLTATSPASPTSEAVIG